MLTFCIVKQAEDNGDKLKEQVKSLHEELISLQLKMSEAENHFRSAISESQEQLEKEVAAHRSTTSALNDARTNLDSTKEKLAKISSEIEKV